ncbi:MAG: TIR domain-containing protein [Synergistaceae bacterium]|nr:TIR domain-containing protein [Synergistaceae bacterium]MBQ8691540.1 TIR domain-containing protein [Synergistaceae bacterium]
MSLEMYQRNLNNLDKDIAALEKKKASLDRKAAEESKKAASVSISKNASDSTVSSKRREIERHNAEARKAMVGSAKIQEQIASKNAERLQVSQKLQKEQGKLSEKRRREQNNFIDDIQKKYEKRIIDLERLSLPLSTKPIQVKEDVQLPEYDVFISHAGEDKDSFVDKFVEELRKLKVKVWYDTSELKWGDSLRNLIDEGLKRSKFGIAIISPNYIAEGKYWTKEEFNALFQRESINGKVLLPIWHNITKQEVMNFSPMLADKKAMTTANMTSKEIAYELAKLLEVDFNGEY